MVKTYCDRLKGGGGVFKFLKMLNIPTRNQSVLIFKFIPPMRNWLKRGGGGKVMRGSNVVEGRRLVTLDSNLKINQWRFSPYLLAYNESFAVIYIYKLQDFAIELLLYSWVSYHVDYLYGYGPVVCPSLFEI